MISFFVSSNEFRFEGALDHLGRTRSAKKIERFMNKVTAAFGLNNIEFNGNNDRGTLWVTFEPEITEEQGEEVEAMWEKTK